MEHPTNYSLNWGRHLRQNTTKQCGKADEMKD
jgi:hypothetical protein